MASRSIPIWSFGPNPNPAVVAPSDNARGYVTAYLLTRFAVGILGVLLPAGLLLGEATFLDGSWKLRGSVSSYYHSPMRDELVGCLCVIGVLLLLHMAGRLNWEFALSIPAGIGIIGLAMFPTYRPGQPRGAIRCGDPTHAEPANCAPMQSAIGEANCALCHYISTGVFFAFLLFLTTYFACGERKGAGRTGDYSGRPQTNWRSLILHVACAISIVVAGILIAVGHFQSSSRIGPLDPLYVAELMTIVAFGISWTVKGAAVWILLLKPNQNVTVT